MEPSSPSKDLASLAAHLALLQTRNKALIQLCALSDEIRTALRDNPAADIRGILARRELSCKQFAASCGPDMPNEEALLEAARQVGSSDGDELHQVAEAILALSAGCKTLAEAILAAQAECEALLKTRLKATANALRQSAQRRKLDAIYGPACKHTIPAFLDRQR
jgi:hypothetical protein